MTPNGVIFLFFQLQVGDHTRICMGTSTATVTVTVQSAKSWLQDYQIQPGSMILQAELCQVSSSTSWQD